jgi:hypothetical protein
MTSRPARIRFEVVVVAESQRWVVTMSGDRPINDVASDIAAPGFAIDEVLGAIGIITGSATDSVAEAVRAIPGVADVSPDQPVDIGPPDSTPT